jgi:hypothetical protein
MPPRNLPRMGGLRRRGRTRVSVAGVPEPALGNLGQAPKAQPSVTPQGPRWYWSIYGINLRGPMPTGVVVQGLADDLAAAKAAFKANWEKLLGAGTVRP